jgi:Na+/H+-dicarboxylate symporter
MKCLNLDTLKRYGGGQLPSLDELQTVEHHLNECAACRALLQSDLSTQSDRSGLAGAETRLAEALLPAADDFHCLDDEQAARYVDGKTDVIERELIEDHLRDCSQCWEDVESLRQFAAEMKGYDWSKTRASSRRERTIDEGVAALGRLRAWAQRLRAGLAQRSLWTRLLVALVLGAIAGWTLGAKAVLFEPISAGVIHLLSVVATPLIFFAILHALMRTQVHRQVFGRLIFLLFTNTLVAALIGLLVANLLHPGSGAVLTAVSPVRETLPPVPSSLFAPLIENNLLYVIVLALGLGVALRERRQEERTGGAGAYRTLEDFIETAYRCLMRLLQWVILLLPLAVFASAAHLVGTSGHRPFQSLGHFTVMVLFALGLQIVYYLIRLRLGSRLSPLRILQETRSVLMTAFWTASSAATMPLAYARVRERLGLREESASLGILVGGNVNRDGTALFEVMGVLFITQAMGVHLGLAAQALLLLMAALASLCAPGIPEAGLVTMTLVFEALHLPQAATYIILLIPLDWLLDRCRTTVNVLGHLTVACLLDGRSPEPTSLASTATKK